MGYKYVVKHPFGANQKGGEITELQAISSLPLSENIFNVVRVNRPDFWDISGGHSDDGIILNCYMGGFDSESITRLKDNVSSQHFDIRLDNSSANSSGVVRVGVRVGSAWYALYFHPFSSNLIFQKQDYSGTNLGMTNGLGSISPLYVRTEVVKNSSNYEIKWYYGTDGNSWTLINAFGNGSPAFIAPSIDGGIPYIETITDAGVGDFTATATGWSIGA